MHAILQWAWAHGPSAANPVTVVDHISPKQAGKKERQPAMPRRAVSVFVKNHVAEFKHGEAARAAPFFLILTATRAAVKYAMRREEFDPANGLWIIPTDRMKAKEAHRVEFSAPALALIVTLRKPNLYEVLVFPVAERKDSQRHDSHVPFALRRSKERHVRTRRDSARISQQFRRLGQRKRLSSRPLPSGNSRILWPTRSKRLIAAQIA
ncbi:phage integrase [Caballeronia peredens]|nr:phage integrase [Caballeronia peredens]